PQSGGGRPPTEVIEGDGLRGPTSRCGSGTSSFRIRLTKVPAAICSADTAVERGMAAVRGLLSRSLHRLDWVVPKAGGLRASVGSTEANSGQPASVSSDRRAQVLGRSNARRG